MKRHPVQSDPIKASKSILDQLVAKTEQEPSNDPKTEVVYTLHPQNTKPARKKKTISARSKRS
jgi:hypothetical protein